MKKICLLLVMVFTIASYTQLNAQSRGIVPPDQDAYPGDPEPHDVGFDGILANARVFVPYTPQEQIAVFEQIFNPALTVIRNVNIAGLSRDSALEAFHLYIQTNPSLQYLFCDRDLSSHLTIQDSCLEAFLIDQYGANPNTFLPIAWFAIGFTIKFI